MIGFVLRFTKKVKTDGDWNCVKDNRREY